MRIEPEIWGDAKYDGYEISLYQVSNIGNVRNKETGHTKKKNFRGNSKAMKLSGSAGKYFYVELMHGKKGERKSRDFKVSRLVASIFCDNPENKPYVDHMNRNRLDDHFENLRWVTARENAANQGPRKGRKFKGVYVEKNHKWFRQEQFEFEFMKPELKYLAKCAGEDLGTFNTEEEAAKAYDIKAKERWGDYAVLNYED